MGLIRKEETTALPTDLSVGPKPVFKDVIGEGQRQGNYRNVAATLTAAIVSIQGLKKEEAWETFKFFHGKMTELDQ